MTDKERLEEIKSRVWKDKGTYAMGDYSQREGYIYTLSDYDYEWLIEQAERVQEVEEELKESRAMYSVVNGERIRYKQALEEILGLDIDVSIYDYSGDVITIAAEALYRREAR